jgi:hypothetical protein
MMGLRAERVEVLRRQSRVETEGPAEVQRGRAVTDEL